MRLEHGSTGVAPLVEQDTSMTVTCSKTGFTTASKQITILDESLAPDIVLFSPNGGEIWSDVEYVSWGVSYPPEDPYQIIIQYQNSKTDWTTYATAYNQESGLISFDTKTLENDGSYKIKVILKKG